jgi:multidrug efflux pump subunit AcrB
MKVSFFIDRPVFSAVISIVIVIVGIIGLTMLPVDQYPQITPPVVKISASYPGASAPVPKAISTFSSAIILMLSLVPTKSTSKV